MYVCMYVPRKALDCLPIILWRAVRSISLTFARYSPVLEIQKDRILFWFYLLRDHSKRVSVASFDKQVKLKYPFVKTKSIESHRLLSFCLYHLDSSFLVLLTIILTAPLGAWHRFDLLFAMELHCVIWPF